MKSDYVPLKGSLAPTFYLVTYVPKDLNTGKTTRKESFMNDYVEEIYEL